MLMSTGVPPMGDPATSPSFPGNGGLLSRSMSTVSNLSKTESKKKGGSSQSITKSYSASSSMTSRKGRSRKRRSSVSDEPLNRSEEVKVPKGKGRRHIFKQRGTARRAPLATATVVTGESVLHRGVYWQKGDVVSVIDSEDGLTYYAMVKGLLSDQYGQKSAVLTWLIPTVEATVGEFHPNKYILGPEDEVPRSLDVMEIVCRTPSEYYLKNSPYPIQETPTDLAYVWGPVKGSAPTLKRKDQLTSTG
ncbi:unnamed protein product [Cyprideis torosa]|uniref:Uncharacterized protein n=1 Tax=Cyprideis torosa TaxID=163714 RepID=A0A7R8W6J4_9CRUS|nr:unnamed protein product [Cyprideis torosa]CAG0886571.1 unnamed protein product [Cyprideis torosa]